MVSRPTVAMQEEVKSCPSMADCTLQPSRAPHDIDPPQMFALTVNETQGTDSTHQVPPLPGMERVRQEDEKVKVKLEASLGYWRPCLKK